MTKKRLIKQSFHFWVTYMKNTFLTFSTVLLILFFCYPTFAQSQHLDSLIQSGIHQIYSLQFEEAEETFSIVKENYPRHPSGKFFTAMITWWKIMVDLDNESYDDEFIDQLNETIDFCEDILDEDPKNIDAIFFKGGSLGFRGRLASFREDWLDAAADGKDALPLVHRAYELDPQNVDVQLGFGIYNYYADVIPEQYPFLKPVMFFFPKGDKEKGIEQLKNAAENGKYTRVESKYFLMTLFYKFEDDNKTALKYAEELFNDFSINPVFQKYYARLLRRTSHLSKSSDEFRVIYNRCDSALFGYNDKLKREASYYIADDHWRDAEFEQAIKYYKECSDLSYSFNQPDDGFNVIALLQLGKVYDILENREKAKEYYEIVLDLDKHRDSHEQAEKYLEVPFKR